MRGIAPQTDHRMGYLERRLGCAQILPRLTYPRLLAREFERFGLDFLLVTTIRDLPYERFELFLDGELMITRTDSTRLRLTPSRCPISSGEGTRFLMTYAVMETLTVMGTL